MNSYFVPAQPGQWLGMIIPSENEQRLQPLLGWDCTGESGSPLVLDDSGLIERIDPTDANPPLWATRVFSPESIPAEFTGILDWFEAWAASQWDRIEAYGKRFAS